MQAVLSAPQTQKSPPRPAAAHTVVRLALFLYLTVILCPLRFCAPSRATLDNSWFFALNYAAVHHLLLGRDIFWTYGPLAYLLAPFAIGSNLIQGLAFQGLLWLVLAIVLWDLLHQPGFHLPSVVLFSFFLALSSLNYSQELYPGNSLLPIALILLVHFHLRGGMPRLVAALILMGLLPLFQFVGAVAAAGIIAGFVLDRLLSRRAGALREIALALFIPSLVSILGLRLALGSFDTVLAYIKSSQELASGYSIAMSLAGTSYQSSFILAAFALLLLAFLLGFFLQGCSKSARFYALVVFPPALIELRHGLVRQDLPHVVQFFSFVALAFALVALDVPWPRRFIASAAAIFAFTFALLWLAGEAADDPVHAVASLTGLRVPSLVWQALHYPSLVRSLQDAARRNSAESGLEPGLRAIVADQPVAYISPAYSNVLGDNLNLVLLPVLQSYSAYTPALDSINAAAIADRGPRFLVYESQAIDNRHAWLEAPATWDAVYRWYDIRTLGERSLLLERRAQPRCTLFQPRESRTVALGQMISIPESSQPLFWTLHCSLNRAGRLRALFYRVPEVTMTVALQTGQRRIFRVILPVLEAPSPANFLPMTLPQFAQVFDSRQPPAFPLPSFRFDGPGVASYESPCHLQFLQVVPPN